jgi:hypothetical protein
MKRRLTQTLGSALILAMFGCLFGSYGVYSLGRADMPWLLAIPLAVAVIMVLVLGRSQKRVEALPPEYADVDETLQRRDARARQVFTLVSAVQAIVILAAARYWFNSPTPEYLAPMAAVIVGLGFIALAGPMERREYTIVGGLLCLLALGAVFTPHASWALVVGIGGAAILWGCYVVQLRAVRSGL